MYKIDEANNSIAFTFSSDMKFIDRLVRDVRVFLDENGTSTHNEVNTVIRELCANSVEHGNKFDAGKNLEVSLDNLGDGRYKISVVDVGEGFDLDVVDMSVLEDPTSKRSRGIPIVNALSDELKYEDDGRKAIAFVTVMDDAAINVIDRDGWKTIAVAGDITAANVNDLRDQLQTMLDEGTMKFRFDLQDVSDVDSLGLSALVVLSKMVAKLEGETGLEMINANKSLLNLFRMTRIDKIYNIVT